MKMWCIEFPDIQVSIETKSSTKWSLQLHKQENLFHMRITLSEDVGGLDSAAKMWWWKVPEVGASCLSVDTSLDFHTHQPLNFSEN